MESIWRIPTNVDVCGLLDLATRNNVVIDDAGKQGFGNHGDIIVVG